MLYRKQEISATPIQLHLKEVYGECYPLNFGSQSRNESRKLR